MVASATKPCIPKVVEKQALMDSGAGVTVCDDDDLYEPNSRHALTGEVVWGDGSTKQIKYAGTAPGIGRMINTGGAAASTLVSVGSTIDELTNYANKDFVMGFDKDASYLVKNARFVKDKNGDVFL